MSSEKTLPSLEQGFIYGLQHQLRGNVTYLTPTTVGYPAGVFIVVLDVYRRTQRCIPMPEGYEFSCMSVSPDFHLLAVCYRALRPTNATGKPEPALLVQYDTLTLKRIRQSAPVDAVTDFLALSYSPDEKYLIAYSCFPDNCLYIWVAEKMTLFTTYRLAVDAFEVRHISCCGYEKERDTLVIGVTGKHIFRIFRMMKNEFKSINQLKFERDILAHTWIGPGSMVLCTADSRLLITNGGDVLCDVSYADPDQDLPSPPYITNVSLFAGNILATLGTGNAVLLDRADEENLFRRLKEFALEPSEPNALAVSPDGDHAVCTMRNGRLYSFGMSSDPGKGEEFKAELIPISIHSERINMVDVCLRKSVFATASDDCTIQMWGLGERRQELREAFDERVHCLSVHPSGGFLVAGFESRVCLMTIYVDSIKASWELSGVRCKLCKFSRGGQYFALVTDNGVTIYNTWTTKVFCQFKGLESNIKTLHWSPNDLKLVTCGTEGLVIVWNLVSRRKETLVSPPAGIQIKDVFFTHDAKAVYMACSDMSIKQMADGNIERELFTDAVLRKITVSASGRLLVAATAHNTIRTYALPLESNVYQEYRCHGSEIRSMVISENADHLFTSDASGCIFQFRLLHNGKRLPAAQRKETTYEMEECLIHAADLKQMEAAISELNGKIEDLNADCEAKMEAKHQANEAVFTDMQRKADAERQTITEYNNRILNSMRRARQEQAAKLDDMRNTAILTKSSLTTSFENSMEEEARKVEKVRSSTEAMKAMWSVQRGNMERVHEERTADVQQAFAGRIELLEEQITTARTEFKQAKVVNAEHMADVEEDVEGERLRLTTHYEQRLYQQRIVRKGLEKEYQTLKGMHDALLKSAAESKAELDQMGVDERKIHGIIRLLQRSLEESKKELLYRDETVEDKQVRIHDLRKKNQELETFKTILELKITGLQDLLRPEEEKIHALSRQLREMDSELTDFQKRYDVLNSEFQDLLTRYKSSLHTGLIEMWRYGEVKRKYRLALQDVLALGPRTGKDIHVLKHHDGDYDGGTGEQREFTALFHQYCNADDADPPFALPQELEERIHYDNERLVHGPYHPLREFAAPILANTAASAASSGSSPGTMQEHAFARQVESLERIANTLRNKLATDNRMQVAEMRRLVKEQSILLRQYNDYKRQSKGSGGAHAAPSAPSDMPTGLPEESEGAEAPGGRSEGDRAPGDSMMDFLTEEGLLIQGTYKKMAPTLKPNPKKPVVLPPLVQM